MDEIKAKNYSIKFINEYLDDIEYWRKKIIDENNLEIIDVKELENLISTVWAKYYKLYKQKRPKDF